MSQITERFMVYLEDPDCGQCQTTLCIRSYSDQSRTVAFIDFAFRCSGLTIPSCIHVRPENQAFKGRKKKTNHPNKTPHLALRPWNHFHKPKSRLLRQTLVPGTDSLVQKQGGLSRYLLMHICTAKQLGFWKQRCYENTENMKIQRRRSLNDCFSQSCCRIPTCQWVSFLYCVTPPILEICFFVLVYKNLQGSKAGYDLKRVCVCHSSSLCPR